MFIACCLNTAKHVSDILLPIIRSLSTAAADGQEDVRNMLSCIYTTSN